MRASQLFVGKEYMIRVVPHEVGGWQRTRMTMQAKLIRLNSRPGWHQFSITKASQCPRAVGRTATVASNSVISTVGGPIPATRNKPANKRIAKPASNQKNEVASLVSLLEGHGVTADVNDDGAIVITGGQLGKFRKVLVATFAHQLM